MGSLGARQFLRALVVPALLLLATVTGCGDDERVMHTLTVGANSGVSICFAAPFVSTVTIAPAAPGIAMKYTVTHDSTVTVSSPTALTGTVLTNASGQASLSVTAVTNNGAGDGTFTVKWEFVNGIDGSGSGSQRFTGNGC
jgi:hypothetical protein